jgi:hypothetical protein
MALENERLVAESESLYVTSPPGAEEERSVSAPPLHGFAAVESPSARIGARFGFSAPPAPMRSILRGAREGPSVLRGTRQIGR